MLSIVIPTLNAAAHLPRALEALYPGIGAGLIKELIVSDGGSRDETLAIAEAAGAEIVRGARGRAAQLRTGAASARAPWLMFLHADTAPDPDWVGAVGAFMARGDAERNAAAFAFAFDDRGFRASAVSALVRFRCAAWKLPYGDQGLIISRAHYDEIGGYTDIPLMEDVDIVRRIGRARLQILGVRARTSAEKYQRDGYFKRSVSNLWLTARYFAGASPVELARRYD